ncbi:hypothetical protein [Sphingomonas xinjiangensis]|nr:hypothetical protein [Sphingomonas xinjiangensis]
MLNISASLDSTANIRVWLSEAKPEGARRIVLSATGQRSTHEV